MRDLWKDLDYSLRNLVTHPGFTLVAVVSLGLGIGLNTTIFSLVNAVLLRPPVIVFFLILCCRSPDFTKNPQPCLRRIGHLRDFLESD